MTVPVYAAAFACIMLSAWISHRVRQRGSIIVAAGAVAIVGYIVLLTTHTAGARYAGAFIAVAGIYSANGEYEGRRKMLRLNGKLILDLLRSASLVAVRERLAADQARCLVRHADLCESARIVPCAEVMLRS
jgi:hypothetical protein